MITKEMSQQHYATACLFTMLCAGAYAKLFLIKDTQHDSKLQGKDYYEEIMSTCSQNRFFEVARMPYETFIYAYMRTRLSTISGVHEHDTTCLLLCLFAMIL